MEKKYPCISVCIITYKRPRQLGILLESLVEQTISAQCSVEIIIVDNDSNGSSRFVVDSFRNRYQDHVVVYDIEPQQGIPLARNRSVGLAQGDFIAFIDDDEKADSQWLDSLYKSIIECQADAVFGPVVPVFPENCPGWLKKGKFYERPHYVNGSLVSTGRTGNALVRKSWLNKRGENPFDTELRLSGGSDSDLFSHMRQEGAKLCWAEHAIVYEFVGQERLNIKWLLMRAFRGGQGTARKIVLQLNLTGKMLHFMYRFTLVLFSLSMVVMLFPFGFHRSIWWLRKAFSNAGQISVFLPYRYEEYKQSNYR